VVIDADSVVQAPFRKPPGLRQQADGATPLSVAGRRRSREMLAVSAAVPHPTLRRASGFDAEPALHALAAPALWRAGRPAFIAVPETAHARCTLRADNQPPQPAVDPPRKAARRRDARAAPGRAVLRDRNLGEMRDALPPWPAQRAGG
jgi:hypothetical protein